MGLFFAEEECSAFRQRAITYTREPSQFSLAWIQQTKKPVYIFGAGGVSLTVRNVLDANIRGYLDNNPALWGTCRHGLMIFQPEAVQKQIVAEEALVILAVVHESSLLEMKAQCRQLGYHCVDWFTVLSVSGSGENLDRLLCEPELKRALYIWDDEKSQRYFRSLIRLRISMSQTDVPEHDEPQYFISDLPKGCHRDFVDAGAFTGDTLESFRNHFGNDFNSYYTFEPVPSHCEKIANLAAEDKRIHLICAAVSEYNGTACITDDNLGSRLCGNGDIVTPVVTLDDTLGTKRVTFVKMDIEGEEPRALRGGERLIKQQRPVLAISIYHQLSHLWEIPLWLHDLKLNYRLLLRHHSRFLTETVCYAIPK